MANFTVIATLLLITIMTLTSAHQTNQLIANRNNRPLRVAARNQNRLSLQNIATGRNRVLVTGQRVLNTNRARNVVVRTGGFPVVSRVGLVGGANLIGGARVVQQRRNFVGSANFVGGANFVAGGNVIGHNLVASGTNLLSGANFIAGNNVIGHNLVASGSNVLGGANFVSGGNLVGLGGGGFVAPSNCCLSRVVPKTVCNTLGGNCALVNRRVCLRKCVPDTVVLGK